MKNYLLFPHNAGDLKDNIFASPYHFLRESLQKRGIDLHTYDLGDLKQADKVLCFNHRPSHYVACRAAGLQPSQLVLFLMEPKPVIPTQYSKKVWDLYGTVFTFLDDLVDNKKFFKMYYPQGQKIMNDLPSFSERKFLTLINANKYSYTKNELYSRRRQAIRYFERQTDFDLYGFGWNHNGALNIGAASQAFQQGRWIQYFVDAVSGFKRSPRYRGTITANDKRATVSNYKFAIAFENEEKTQGYITEKIFDCLFAGTVPVYLGADNITSYIPDSCFIDMRKFPTFEALEQRLRSMSESEWQSYHEAGQALLHSAEFSPWTPANVFTTIAAQL